jgi:transglycosylase-like protein
MRKTAMLAIAGATTMTAAAPAAAQQDSPLRAELAGHHTVAAQMRAERRENVREDLVARAARLSDEPRAERRRLRGASADEVRERIRDLRRPPKPPAPAVPAVLEAIAACESGGDPTTDTGNGFYGKYQFTLSTWQSVGGTGNPAQASEAEQDRRAAMLYAQAGSSPWPVCGA